MKINMSEIANHGDAELDMIEVPAGKQSADIHIGSYIGYLAGINKGRDCSIVVVSKDTDFDNVIKFWKKELSISVSRKKKLQGAAAKKQTNTSDFLYHKLPPYGLCCIDRGRYAHICLYNHLL